MNQTDSWCSLLTTKIIISVYHTTQRFFFHLEAEKSISTLNTGLPLFNPQTEVSFDEGLWFFMPRGDKGSNSGRCSEQVGFVPLPLVPQDNELFIKSIE